MKDQNLGIETPLIFTLDTERNGQRLADRGQEDKMVDLDGILAEPHPNKFC